MKSPESPVGTVVFDLDGVVYIGSTPIPGAAEAMARLVRSGWQLIFATNNSTTTPNNVAQRLREQSYLTIDERSVVTSGASAGHYLSTVGVESALVVGSQQLRESIAAYGIFEAGHDHPDAVVVGLDRDLDYQTIDDASRAIRNGARFVATNTDATFPTSEGEAPGAGAIVAAIAYATGQDFVSCGKPARPMIDLISQQVRSERVIVVGDRLETDIALAHAAGWGSVLTLTGVTSSASDIGEEFAPDVVIASMHELPKVLELWDR